MSTDLTITRALISVSDKTGLVEFAQALARHKVQILSTGGTAKTLKDAGLAVTDVSQHTGFPEILDGRVKTLHPLIHGAILAKRDDSKHRMQMETHKIKPIDLVVVNLYPFVETVASGADFDTCIENIDIGGPAMIRAAAKNHANVGIITDPGEYESVVSEMDRNHSAIGPDLRRWLACEAYARTAAYDAHIARWMSLASSGETFPKRLTFPGRRRQVLRYGENPHQEAALYATTPARPGVASADQIQGKELSFNNINDADAAFELAAEFAQPSVVIVKHANPCGVASADTLSEAWEPALACDPVSAFGGIVAVNRAIDEGFAQKLIGLFLEVVIAPSATEQAKAVLASKANLRLLVTGEMPDPKDPSLTVRSISGGLLVQSRDHGRIEPDQLKTVTQRAPTAQELRDLVFAWRVAKHVKSNAIVYARGLATVGIGAGQMSRVDSARIAAWKSAEHAGTQGSVVASDAFFPFADGLKAAIAAGATAVIQPGGSIRDPEVIAAADEAGIAMVFTGMRHFRH